MSLATLRHADHTVRIDDGELVSYRVGDAEFVHQKGSPGWRSADAEMFPIVGPTAAADFTVATARGSATQDQHGLLRELGYRLTESDGERAVYEKVYTAGTPVPNSKYPAKSTAEHLAWPYDFRFRKTLRLGADGLDVTFELEAEPGMPFMLGYHPAFRLESAAPRIVGEGVDVPLADVLAVGDRALHLPGQRALEIVDGDRRTSITARGFGAGFMCWAPVATMVCVEPVTFYPYDVSQDRLAEGFDEVGAEGREGFGVRIVVRTGAGPSR